VNFFFAGEGDTAPARLAPGVAAALGLRCGDGDGEGDAVSVAVGLFAAAALF
jgi:hypothetical protein